MSELPANWATCTLGELVERIETGKSVKCDERPPQGLENGLVKISAVTWGEFDENESKTLFDSAHLKPEEKIQTGDFLISRANTLELVGSCVLVKSLSKNLYLSDKVLRLVLPNKAKPWLLVCLRSQAGRQQIESLATGNQLSMRNISQQALKEIRIPLPPLAEQTRIAAKLDELLAQVDTLKARIESIPALLKRFRQSVLAAAVSGRLTEEWRNTGGGNWVGGRLREFVSIDIGHAFKSSEFSTEGVRLLRGQNIEPGALRWTETKYFSNKNLPNFERLLISEGDIILAMDRPIISSGLKLARAKKEDLPCLLVQRVCRFKEFKDILNEYLMLLLSDWSFSNYLIPNQTGSDIPHISGKQILNYPITLPSLGEQTEIVRRVEQLFAFADQLEARVKAAQARIDRLTQSILAKAFRGELVPQDPNDEPASVLLERIKAQRAAAPKAKRGRQASKLS